MTWSDQDRWIVRVVLCDQHVAFAESLAFVLTARGDDVVGVVHDLRDAIAIVEREPIDICVVDADEPDRLQDLRTLCRAIGDAPVVLLAAEADAEMQSRAVQAGVRAVAAKRQSLSEVLKLLGRALSGERVLTAEVSRSRSAGQRRHRTEGQRLAEYLSPRERQVLSALVRGEDTAMLARSLGTSTNTARSHVQNLLSKLGTHSRLATIRVAVQMGMVDPRTGDWLIDLQPAS
jgi:two-component system nitrate/nitrite response regulator NarL